MCDASCMFTYRRVKDRDLYICRNSRNVHVCGENCELRMHNRDSTLVCPISGRCFQQTISNNAYKNEPRTGFTTLSLLRQELYTPSSASRRQRKRPRVTRRVKIRFDDVKCERLLKKIFSNVDGSDRRLSYYCSVIKQLWEFYYERMETSGHTRLKKPHFDAHVVGTLFLCKDGLSIKGQTVLPQDLFLNENIPSMMQLSRLDIPRKWIRIGKNNLLSVDA